MNHALQNTILASAVAGVTLLFVLLAIRAGAPEQMETRAGHYSGSAPVAERMASDLPTHFVVGLGIGAFSHALAGNGIAHGVPGSALVQASARVAESAVAATRARISGHFAPPAQSLPAATRTQDLPREGLGVVTVDKPERQCGDHRHDCREREGGTTADPHRVTTIWGAASTARSVRGVSASTMSLMRTEAPKVYMVPRLAWTMRSAPAASPFGTWKTLVL